MKIWGWVRFLVIFILVFAGWVVGCGKGTKDQPKGSQGGQTAQPDMRVVKGTVPVGVQCQYGSISAPRALHLALWDCPIQVQSVELIEPMRAFTFQADCKKKTLDMRSPSREFDPVSWEIMPDGNFYFSMSGGVARFKDDGSGNVNCGTPTTVDVWGRVDCEKIDKPIIRFEAVWWLGKVYTETAPAPHPSVLPSGFPSGTPSGGPSSSPAPIVTPSPTTIPTEYPFPTCKMPSGCYLHTIARIDQCS